MFNLFKKPSNEFARAAASPTTPDEIITAKIIDSFARELSDWKAEPQRQDDLNDFFKGKYPRVQSETGRHYYTRAYILKVVNKKRNLTVDLVLSVENRLVIREVLSDRHWFNISDSTQGTVNGIPIGVEAIVDIVKSWDSLKKAYAVAEATAKKAKKAMEDNEKKWNLIEESFGIKRDKLGQIVFNHYEVEVK